MIIDRLSIETASKRLPLLVLVLLVAVFLRFFLFPAVPAGVNQDEADAGYEAYSLLHHGTDKWGNKWPAYFISWGSGQNVLESYLDIPVVAAGGLNRVTIRIIPALCGVLSVLLLYLVLRLADECLALLGSFMLAVFPWAVLSSRLGVESNILPFFILFGIWAFIYSYRSYHRRYLIPLSLVPFALALYAYVVAVFVIPALIVGLLVLYRREVLACKVEALISLAVMAVLSIPIGLFLLVNLVLHHVPSALAHLPFSVPLLLVSRLAQNDDGGLQTMALSNIHFITSGFVDGEPWSNMGGYVPAFVYLPLALLACALVFRAGDRISKVFATWFLASFLIGLTTPLNDVRGNSLMIPLVALAAVALVAIIRELRTSEAQILAVRFVLVLIGVYSAVFFAEYFPSYNTHYGYAAYNVGFPATLTEAKQLAAPGENIYVTQSVNLNYVYVLYYLRSDSGDFQEHAQYTPFPGLGYSVVRYRNYYFTPNSPELRLKSYVYILKDGDSLVCARMVNAFNEGGWRVGTCEVAAASR